MTDHAASTVVLVDPRLGTALPGAAVPALRAATAVYVAADVPRFAAYGDPVPEHLEPAPVVLITADADRPEAVALRSAGAATIAPEPVLGAELLAAVEVMRRLRSPGGCPWDAEQTHDSLYRYLREETYEVLDAIDAGDRITLREELGDVLLQVLFHSAVATEDPDDPFTVDMIADGLVRKLVSRHPHVFGDGDSEVRDAASQERRWDELKRKEKKRESSVDGVALDQPALALAMKVIERTTRAGLPTDLLPSDVLFGLATEATLAGGDPERELRRVVLEMAAQVRQAERAARDAGLDPAALDADAWRKFWPGG
jgi:XTP/dITP diphosphohydrolase